MNIQIYLDAFFFVVANTNILSRFGWTLAISILLGALILDRFRAWAWIMIVLAFIIFTQWQIESIITPLGYSPIQFAMPYVIAIMSGLIFTAGFGMGFWIKKKCVYVYTKISPESIAKNSIEKVNGGEHKKSDPYPNIQTEEV